MAKKNINGQVLVGLEKSYVYAIPVNGVLRRRLLKTHGRESLRLPLSFLKLLPAKDVKKLKNGECITIDIGSKYVEELVGGKSR